MLSGILGLGREWGEAILSDTVSIASETTGDWLPERKEYATVTTVHYTGQAGFKTSPGSAAAPREDAGALVTVHDTVLKLPVTDETAGIPIGAIATVTASPHDPASVGAKWRITRLHVGSATTTRRFRVERYIQGA